MKKIIILLCALAFLGIAFAATVTVGTGTATSSYLPFYGLYNYSYSQQIYTQAQINEAGDISKIRFYYVSGTITNNKDWVIYMGHTAKTAFASNTDWEPLANLTQVFAGDVSSMVPSVNNWMEITLSTPFPYNNSDNLVVAVDENTSGYSSMSWGAFTSGTNTGIYYYSDGTNPNPASPPSASSRVALIDRMQFVFPATAAPLAPTLVSPADGGTSFAVGKLTWTPTAGGEDPTDYDVYFGTAATPPLVSSAQTATSYSPTMVVGNTYYWNVVAHNAIGYSSASPTRSFTVVPGVVIGDGTNTSLNLPLNPYYGYNYSQTLYLQSEINISGQRIEKLYYNWNGLAAGTNSKDWTIYMGHTTKTAFASTSDWVPFGDMSQVFSGVVTIPASPGWIEIILTAPFVYNNTENLVIAVNETGSGDDGSAAKFFGTSFAANRGLRVQNDTSAYNPASPGTAYERVAGIANIKMMFGDIPVNGVLVVNPSPVACGSSYVGVQKRVTVSLSNTGGAAFDVSSIALDDLTNFQLGTLPTFPITLNPAAAPVTFDVIFLPTAAGALTANLLIGDNRNPPIVVSGTGVASQVGEICENPYIATLPIVDYAGTTFGFANDYTTAMYTGLTSTLYQNGWDWVAKVTVPTLGALTVNLANPVGNTISQYMAVYLVNTIPSLASPAAVLGQAYASSGPISISNATVSAGDYYIIVDNWATPDGIDFVLNASFESASNPPSPAVLVAPTPTGVTGIAVNPTLSWTTGGGIVEKYFVSYGTQSPLTTIVDNFDNGTATTYSPLPLLAYSTEYWWTVTPWNSVGGNATGVTPWTFTTIPNPTISTFPYTEGFEVAVGTLPANWTVTTGASSSSYNWKAATSAAHGPAAPAVGSSFAWLYCYLASTSNNPYSMITPPIALDATAKRLSYQYWIGDDTVAEPLFVDISTDLATWTTLYTHSNASNTLAWHENMIGLETYASSTVYLRFRGVSSYSNNMTDLAIDNVIVRDTPTGPPDAVTLVSPVDNATDMPKNGFNLTWSPVNTGGTPTSYTVYMASSVESIYEEEAFNGITGTSFNPVTDGLMSFNYEERWFWTVEAVNGDGSAVVDPPFSFDIQADPSIASFPWNEGFETASFPPNGWSMLDADGDGENWFLYTADGAAHTGLNSAGSASWTSTAGALTPNNWLITPPITIPATGEYLVEYYAAGQDPAYPDEHYGFYVSTTGTAPADFTLLFQETFEDAEWNYRMQNLSSYAGQTVYFAFRHFNSSDVFYMKIDDVAVREVPPVPTFSYSPAAWDFGTLQLLNPSTAKNFVLANTGAGNITINSGDIVLNDAEGNFVLTAANLPATLSGTTSYTFSVQFIPQSLGTKTATITIQDNITREIHTINLSGEAIAEPIVGIINLAGVAQLNNASLTWAGIYGSPGTPGYLHWDDTIMRGNVGAGANSYNVAVKFGTEAMAASAGMELTNVMIHLAEQPQTVDNLIIWTGTDTALTPVAIAYTQAVSGLVVGWNNITLTTPVAVTGTDAIYVGYHVNGIADTFPASTDGLTAVTNRGNLVDLGGWTTLTSSSIAGNWLIHAYFNAPSTMLSRRPVSVQSIPVVSQPLTQNDLRNLPIEARTTANADRALRGFNIYRDGLQINADIVAAYSYLDEGLAAGTYNYAVQSVHYSTNGVISGTVPVTILPPAPPIALPFTETWDIDFETNMWTAGSTNWAINTSNGAPAPSATFTWNPQVVDYSIALASYEFDATGVNSVQFSFDLALGNFSLDAENVMSWEIWDGTIWNTLGSYSSLDDDLGWTRFAYDVSTYASDRIFKIRFVASGEDSYEIDRWYIDNVHVAELPTTVDPVTDLGIAQTGTDLVLSWTAITGADWYYIYTSEDPYGTFNALGFVEGAGISLPTSMFPADKTFIKVTAGAGPFPRGERLDIAPAAKRK